MHHGSRKKGENPLRKNPARQAGCRPWNFLHRTVSREDIHRDRQPELKLQMHLPA